MPLFDASKKFWESIKISFISGEFGKLSPFLTQLSEKYANGKVMFGHFKIQVNHFDKDFPKTLLFQYFVKEKLFYCKEIQKCFCNYKIFSDVDLTKVIEEVAPFELPGCLASILHIGGAYSTLNSSMDDFYTGLNAAIELTDGNLKNGMIWFSRNAWSDFFLDVAWDNTVIIYKPQTDDLEIILATDTD